MVLGDQTEKGFYTDFGYRWRYNLYQRDDHDHLFKLFSKKEKLGPIKFYNTQFFNHDVYDKTEEDTNNKDPIADIWVRLNTDQA